MVKKLINFQYPKLMALSGLLFCMIVLCASNSQNSAFAQNSSSIMPDLRTFFSDAIFPNSYSNTDSANIDDRSHSSKVSSDAQGTTKAEDETTTAPQVDETTTSAEEEIEVTKKQANEALFESGIIGLGF